MANRKKTNKYYFTVEGETEQWYLEWLVKQLNNDSDAMRHVSFDCEKRDPIEKAKSLPVTHPIYITHLFDYESNEEVHKRRFSDTLDKMEKVNTLGKGITYKLGYSNFSFELWLILHKKEFYEKLADRRQYLQPISRIFNERFENLEQLKHKDDFARVLKNLCLHDVKKAIHRAKTINDNNKTNGYALINYKGFTYYRENPSLSIWESLEEIFIDCGLMMKLIKSKN